MEDSLTSTQTVLTLFILRRVVAVSAIAALWWP